MVWQQFRQWAGKIVVRQMGLVLGLGLTAIAPNLALAAPLESGFLPHISDSQRPTTTLMANEDLGNLYLLGTAPQAEQLGQDYMVLRVMPDQRVQGVFYQVNSEFACFDGEVKNGTLNLAVIDPYEQVAYNHQLPYQAGGYVAANGDRLTVQFVPEGFQVIGTPSRFDRDLFAQCGHQTKSVSILKG